MATEGNSVGLLNLLLQNCLADPYYSIILVSQASEGHFLDELGCHTNVGPEGARPCIIGFGLCGQFGFWLSSLSSPLTLSSLQFTVVGAQWDKNLFEWPKVIR